MDIERPHYYEPRNPLFEHLRLPNNIRRWRWWHIITYKDYYQAYLSISDFKLRTRLEFDYNAEVRLHMIKANLTSQKSPDNGILSFSWAENHHVFYDIIISKNRLAIDLLYDPEKVSEQVDEYLTVERRWIDDAWID